MELDRQDGCLEFMAVSHCAGCEAGSVEWVSLLPGQLYPIPIGAHMPLLSFDQISNE